MARIGKGALLLIAVLFLLHALIALLMSLIPYLLVLFFLAAIFSVIFSKERW